MASDSHQITFTYLSQEDLLEAGCLDVGLAVSAAENAMLAYRNGEVMFPDKIVQIFNEDTQERINCLPATLKTEKVCGVKWVSVFPPNVVRFGLQNLTAMFLRHNLRQSRRQSRFAVVNMTNRANVHVRLCSLKFLFRHESIPFPYS